MKDEVMKNVFRILGISFGLMASIQSVQAHVVFSEPQAIAGTYHKATLRVGHGCNGSSTTSLIVQVPSGFQGAKPQPKTGWTITTRKAKLAQPYNSHGKTVTDDVVELRWTAASKENALPDDQFDEFAFMGRLPDKAGPLWVKVLQTCETGQNDWSDIPVNGTSTRGMKLPAALLDVQPAPTHEHHH
jgi:periplasmic copper chaperone A